MREPETTKLSLCEELGIGLVAWGPLGQGFLTGKITRDTKFIDPNDLRKDFPRFTPEVLEAKFKVVNFLKDLTARKKITPAQIALAWLLAQKPWIVPIPVEDDFRKRLPRFTPEALEKNQALVDLLKRIADEKKATPAQIALAWLLAKKPWICRSPVPPSSTGSRRTSEQLTSS